MKGILGLYVEMLQQMDITTIKQAKRLVTNDDLRLYRIPLSQHNWKYVSKALYHIAATRKNKTAPKSKSVIRALSMHQSRQKYLDFIDKRLKELPDGSPFKEALKTTRIAIADQQVPLSDADF